MRSYFKVYYMGGVFYANWPGGFWRGPESGGNDQVFAVTFIPPGHRKANFVQYLNQIVPLASTPAGAIAVSQIGFFDYGPYHDAHPDG